ncbi:predicted protein [Plenodomus lingam JN3]|uniref:Predicted protein n=1 Tax=Leptosphaeria maculans (strain JN3 / isolate v23.1.3 / race Av1-4-5-6-7-8) TaxID=985895 RepID=E4ZPQ7_LEPMJ|nr:predicted protein [Plenodomus lingam JN3]CBX93442.1 predicted protein [Plenodomus lingam JN3]
MSTPYSADARDVPALGEEGGRVGSWAEGWPRNGWNGWKTGGFIFR